MGIDRNSNCRQGADGLAFDMRRRFGGGGMKVPGVHAADNPLAAFQGCGIELEYALVDRASIDVRPIADSALREAADAQAPVTEARRGMFGWSNELALHVLELKNIDPT